MRSCLDIGELVRSCETGDKNLTRARLSTNYYRLIHKFRPMLDQGRDIIVFLTNKKRGRHA